MLPKRVGEPSASPPHSSRSRNSTYGAPSGGTLGSAVVDDGRDRWNGAQPCVSSIDLIDALRDRLGQQPSRAGARVVENENIHAVVVMQMRVVRLRSQMDACDALAIIAARCA